MVCLVINCILGLMLVVYLSLGNERPSKMQFQQREYFTGAELYTSTTSIIVECIAACMKHLPQCWAVQYTNGIKLCELLWKAMNQTPIINRVPIRDTCKHTLMHKTYVGPILSRMLTRKSF